MNMSNQLISVTTKLTLKADINYYCKDYPLFRKTLLAKLNDANADINSIRNDMINKYMTTK